MHLYSKITSLNLYVVQVSIICFVETIVVVLFLRNVTCTFLIGCSNSQIIS